jgi:hypothetical protein
MDDEPGWSTLDPHQLFCSAGDNRSARAVSRCEDRFAMQGPGVAGHADRAP